MSIGSAALMLWWSRCVCVLWVNCGSHILFIRAGRTSVLYCHGIRYIFTNQFDGYGAFVNRFWWNGDGAKQIATMNCLKPDHLE